MRKKRIYRRVAKSDNIYNRLSKLIEKSYLITHCNQSNAFLVGFQNREILIIDYRN